MAFRFKKQIQLRATICLLLATVFSASAQRTHLLKSPDGKIRVSIAIPRANSDEHPHWSASFHDKKILNDCKLGLQTKEAGELLANTRVLDTKERSGSERIQIPFGKTDHANSRFREIRYALENRQHHRIDVVFRCYDDAIALRYELPEQKNEGFITIIDETTSFRLDGEPTAFAQYLENYQTSHEHNVTQIPFREIKPDTLLDLPLTFSWSDNTCMAITEAALRHYAGMALMRSATNSSRNDLVCKLTPRADGTKVIRMLPMQTPWRVVLIGDRPGALLESTTIFCLNDPPAFKDISWIKPGKITFPWWNGDVYDGKPSEPILSFGMAKKYIDFCASNNIPTHSLTSTEVNINPWYHQSNAGVVPGPDTDVTRPREGFELAKIKNYADSKGVRLWTWVHQAALRGRIEEAFAAFEKLGWSGMMVDFFDHDDQDSVEFAESILNAAARHHIMIHLHGVWKPTGFERTYPNLMNHEGALNLEYLKFGGNCTPEHDLMMSFTRLIAGPMDYHLGGFRAVPRPEFKLHMVAPNVLGTRCHMLAMYVCFDNPNPMIADYPVAYENQPGFDFLKIVPTWWDETKILSAQIGELLVTARRKGSDWYLGGLSAKQPREVSIPLAFLGKQNYIAKIWRDAADTDPDPNHLVSEIKTISLGDTLKIHIAADGGFVAELLSVQ